MKPVYCDPDTLIMLGFRPDNDFNLIKAKRHDGVSIRARITRNDRLEVSVSSKAQGLKGAIVYYKPIGKTDEAGIRKALAQAVRTISRTFPKSLAGAAAKLLPPKSK